MQLARDRVTAVEEAGEPDVRERAASVGAVESMVTADEVLSLEFPASSVARILKTTIEESIVGAFQE